MKLVKTAAGMALLAGILGPSVLAPSVPALAATGTTAPAGGLVRVWVTLKGANGSHGTILITGAIGDWGTTLNTNANGTPNPNGNYGKVMLQKGTFIVNLTTVNALSNKVAPTVYPASCSAIFNIKGPAGLSGGTGAYKGISGTINLTETFAVILPRYGSGAHMGQCDLSENAQPLAQTGTVSGTGMVGFGHAA